MLIRPERESDWPAVHAVNMAAFGRPAEADLVDAVREQCCPVVSLVAEEDGEIIGHILFSPVTLSGHADAMIMGLGPLAVWPAHQRQGIGSALALAGLERCRELGAGAVVVLGHASYYPRFGFKTSTCFGIRSAFDVPEEAFMVVELLPGYLNNRSGVAHYHPVFDGV